jgi:hypothetical protein
MQLPLDYEKDIFNKTPLKRSRADTSMTWRTKDNSSHNEEESKTPNVAMQKMEY